MGWHSYPSPAYPSSHLHTLTPGPERAHFAFTWQGASFSLTRMQASMAAHLLPLPEYPSLHAQVPLTQIALSSLHATPTGQFSVNVHVLPEPVKPLLHEQRFEPLTIVHSQSSLHSEFESRHPLQHTHLCQTSHNRQSRSSWLRQGRQTCKAHSCRKDSQHTHFSSRSSHHPLHNLACKCKCAVLGHVICKWPSCCNRHWATKHTDPVLYSCDHRQSNRLCICR